MWIDIFTFGISLDNAYVVHVTIWILFTKIDLGRGKWYKNVHVYIFLSENSWIVLTFYLTISGVLPINMKFYRVVHVYKCLQTNLICAGF